jgi:hypothetical protein
MPQIVPFRLCARHDTAAGKGGAQSVRAQTLPPVLDQAADLKFEEEHSAGGWNVFRFYNGWGFK